MQMEKNREKIYSLKGQWQVRLSDGSIYQMLLPGTLDTNDIGYPDKGANQWHPEINLGNATETIDETAPIATRFTRKHTYEGAAVLSRQIDYVPTPGTRVFLEAERARVLRLWVDEQEVSPVPDSGTLSTPYVFEITGLLKGNNKITLVSDNSYPGLPHDDIVYSSAATDETQTNWNGILGYIRLREEAENYIESMHVYPHGDLIDINVTVSLSGQSGQPDKMVIQSEVMEQMEFRIGMKESLSSDTVQTSYNHGNKIHMLFKNIKLHANVRKWDEYEGNLYTLKVTLYTQTAITDSKEVTFGIRTFGYNEKGRFTLNNRCIFIRSEANCAEFPEEGHPPMDVESWMNILSRYQEYGINYMRFHSHCPPDAAFTAADRLGILMQPELSHWNPKDALESEESYQYYKKELKAIIETYANHPSFVALTLGNELHNQELGQSRMEELVKLAQAMDSTRRYAIASNGYYGARGCDPVSDFYTSQKYYEKELRGCFAAESEVPGEKGHLLGYINNHYPNAKTDYEQVFASIRRDYDKPVFSFEVGQYEILPDFAELSEFKGISDPANFRLIQKRVEDAGLSHIWKEYVEATGELSLIGYREEVEAVLRTPSMSGISLLGLQDFPGQGTALVGMMNSHLEAKPYDFARPQRFRSFFRETLPLVELEKYTYETGEVLRAKVRVANYGRQDLEGVLEYQLTGEGVQIKGKFNNNSYSKDSLTCAGEIQIPLTKWTKACELKLEVRMVDQNKEQLLYNQYPIWVYPVVTPRCPENVYEARYMDETAGTVLEQGGIVYLSPDATREALPHSIRTQFTTDFWSVGTFAAQEGGMGQYIDVKHPIFRSFPTQKHTNWQWWSMATQRAVILPGPYQAIVTQLDSYAYLRPMAQLIEWQCGKGKVLLSTFGLHNLLQYPEARALQDAIYHYLGSEEFAPQQHIAMDELTSMVCQV